MKLPGYSTFAAKELTAQTGHDPADWPLVILKELVDNSLDSCEEGKVAPAISVTVDERGITVADNGPGIPAETVRGIRDYAVRVSSREAYVNPAQSWVGAIATEAALAGLDRNLN